MEKIKYSVLIPVYNVEKYLPECLDSILNQTYPRFEAIIIDDGSTDGSGYICDRYAEYDSRFKVYHQTNEGIMMARRTGILKASGEYCFFLDADDYYDIFLLEKIDDFLQKSKCDMIFFNMKLVYTNKEKKYPRIGIHTNMCTNREALEKLFENNTLFSVVTKAVKRELLLDLADKIFIPINHCEDLLQTFSLLLNSNNIGILEEHLYYYRIRKRSLVHTTSVSKIKEVLETESYIIDRMQTENIITNKEIENHEGFVLNNFLENVFKLNCEHMRWKEHIESLKEVFLIENIKKINTKKNRKKVKKYNFIRLWLLMKGYYRLLFIIDRILYVIKCILQICKNEQAYA